MAFNNAINARQTGFQSLTSAGVWNGRTLTAGAGISITNGDGTGGNPVITATGGAVQTFTYISTGSVAAGTIDFTSLSNTYKAYRFIISGVTGSNTTYQMMASTDNLSTFATLNCTNERYVGGAPQVPAASSQTATRMAIGTLATLYGRVDIYNIGEATKAIMFEFGTGSNGTGTNSLTFFGKGNDNVRESINSIRFTSNTDSLTAGTVDIYGIS